MRIKLPQVRAYYPWSKNERDQLLCWIPPTELAQLASEQKVRSDILEDYPDGLELEVTESAFDEFDLDLGISPEILLKAYIGLDENDALPESGLVEGTALESFAKSLRDAPRSVAPIDGTASFLGREKLPEPEMTDGEDAQAVMRRL